MEMSAEELNKMYTEFMACKTYKEAKKLEKQWDKKYTQDDVIRCAMQYGQEQLLASLAAHVKELDDKQGLTLGKRLMLYKKKLRLFFYYHNAVAYYVAEVGTGIPLILVYDTVLPDVSLMQLFFVSFHIMLTAILAGSWFSSRMKKVN